MSSKEWKEGTLEELADIIMGQSPLGENCNAEGNGIPLLNGPTEFGNKFPIPVQYTIDPKKISSIGDILFCVRGSTTGKMNWADEKYAIGRGLAALRHKNGINYQHFLKGILDVNLSTLLAEATGSTFPNVSSQQLAKLNILLPPLPTQQKIAKILSSLDDKIELNRQTNQTLEAITQNLFKEWFVNFNYPGATGEMQDSELGQIPKGWRVGKLGEIAQNFDNKRIPLSSREREKRKGKYRYYGAASILGYIDDYIFDGTYLLLGEDGTVITADERPVLQYVTGKFWVNNHAHVLQGKNEITTEFLMLLLQVSNVKHLVTGAVQPKINQGNLNSLDIIIPDKGVLYSFQDIISPVYKNILFCEQQTQTLTQLRDTLLPKLMRGEVKV